MRPSPLILHDAFTFPGGGERVAALLAQEFSGMLWTARFVPEAFPPHYFAGRPPMDMRALERHPGLAKRSETACLWRCFSEFPQSKPPFTVFSGSLAPMAYRRTAGPKILYCHTPPRILFDQRQFYLSRQRALKAPLYKAFLAAFGRAWVKAARSMDRIVANSQNVASRLGRYLQLDSVIVSPPVNTAAYAWKGQEDFYLSTARVDQLKRVEVIVEAFVAMPDKRLVVVSGGSELERVRALAAQSPNIQVLGWVAPETLVDLMGRCLATVYIPRSEDFGISPVESMAAGKPVIGVAEGGLLETVKENVTGLLLPPNPGPQTVAEAVRAMTAERALAMRQACHERAALFDDAVFRNRMRQVVEEVLAACRRD
ncbi:glycosyltransferase [Fundidesulfovibrio butyratiphilus]